MAEPVLTIEHLTKKYDSQTVLYDINLQVHQGEVIVIVGPSGSGKSTLLRCINALEEIQNGEIRLRGELITAGASGRVTSPIPSRMISLAGWSSL